MVTLNLPLELVYSVLLVFLRVVGIVFSAPLFDSSTIPVIFKTGLALAVSILVAPTLHLPVAMADLALIPFVIGVISEIFIGVAIGLSVKLIFSSIQLAGQVAGYQMGFAIANVMDPVTSLQIPILSQVYNVVAMLVFVTVDGHHIFVRALVDSYAVVPPLLIKVRPGLAGMMMKMGADLFIVAVRIGAPLIAVMLLTSVGLGLVARTVPQMNVFIVAMPLQILIGLLFMMICAPFLTAFLVDLFATGGVSMYQLLRLLRP
ncbi:flagellar biosynthetic protein FliR [Desulfosarcina sp. OttesenSCG-928-G10]|nr:flagellar biosynthetic protein FliR [Desulfosarcina sp. OttesenSCG-928-G10]MDL2321748.1 flagellar biosynthetic protein FliR [Desulfosarcina sp. OttesenSCG-928-B08]